MLDIKFSSSGKTNKNEVAFYFGLSNNIHGFKIIRIDNRLLQNMKVRFNWNKFLRSPTKYFIIFW